MEKQYIKLSEYAKSHSLTYKTAYKHFKAGILNGKQLITGTILILNDNMEVKNVNHGVQK